MLSRISSTKLETWRQYEQIEPFTDERLDLNAAHIVQYLWALAGDPNKRYPNGRKLGEFLLKYGSVVEEAPASPVQTVEFQEMVLSGWCAVNNILAEKKAKHGN